MLHFRIRAIRVIRGRAIRSICGCRLLGKQQRATFGSKLIPISSPLQNES
jgi:hypothetical protein